MGLRPTHYMSPPVWAITSLFFHCMGKGRSTFVRAGGLDFDVNYPIKKCDGAHL